MGGRAISSIMRAAVMVLVLLVCLSSTGLAVSGERLANVSGPDVLKGMGPSDPRVDSVWPAVFTAVVVAGVILRGMRKGDGPGGSENGS